MRIVLAGIFTLPLVVSGPWVDNIRAKNYGIIWQGVALALWLWFYFYLPSNLNAGLGSELHWMQLSMIFAWSVPIVGMILTGKESRGWSKQFLFRLFVGLLSAVIVGAGISASLVSIENLFGVNIDSVVYGDVWICCFALIAVSVWLSQLHANPEDRNYWALFRFFWLSIFLPLAGLYALILLTYGLKILITGVWPQGVVVRMVLGYMIFGVIAYLLTYPLRQDLAWLRKIHAAFFVSLLLFSILLFSAIGIRLSQYGLTTERYLVVAGGVRMVVVSLIALLRPAIALNAGIVAFVACLALTAYGPQSAVNLPTKMQYNTLVSLLERNWFLENGRIVPHKVDLGESTAQPMSGDIADIYSAANYLGQERGPEVFKSLYAGTGFEQLSVTSPWSVAEQFMVSLGVDNVFANVVNVDPSIISYSSRKRHALLPISDYTYYLQLPSDERSIISHEGLRFEYAWKDKGRVTIAIEWKEYKIDLYKHLDAIKQAAIKGANENLEFTWSDYILVLSDLFAEQQADGFYRIQSYNGYVFLK